MAFLADAEERGVLRQSGIVYEFRHLRLRHQLASQHPSLSLLLASKTVAVICSYNGPLLRDFLKKRIGEWSPNSTAPWSKPFWYLRFRQYASGLHEAKDLMIGRPAKGITDEGIGYSKVFRGVDEGQSWVMCARPGERPALAATRMEKS